MKLTLRMITTLVVITMSSAAVLSGINRWAEPRIEEHAARAREEAIFTLHPGAEVSEQNFEYGPENLPVYSVFDDTGDSIGYTFIAAGSGYQGEIRMMVGLTKDLDRLTGLVILAQEETPGLGARIEEKTEEPETREDYRFLNWFEGLNPDPQIDYVRTRMPEENNQIRAITGATISSESVVEIINRAYPRVKELLPEPADGEAKENEQPG